MNFFSFARIMSKSVGKNISKDVSGESSQRHFVHTKQSATDALKTALKGAIQKTAERAGDLIGNKMITLMCL